MSNLPSNLSAVYVPPVIHQGLTDYAKIGKGLNIIRPTSVLKGAHSLMICQRYEAGFNPTSSPELGINVT
uniref:Oxidored_FMN domain-containing protein n=1 Tax=Syphacia muris TaxID=451379 RepID=A0A0N5AJ16_9BILA